MTNDIFSWLLEIDYSIEEEKTYIIFNKFPILLFLVLCQCTNYYFQ